MTAVDWVCAGILAVQVTAILGQAALIVYMVVAVTRGTP